MKSELLFDFKPGRGAEYCLVLKGDWSKGPKASSSSQLRRQITATKTETILIEAASDLKSSQILTGWLYSTLREIQKTGVQIRIESVPAHLSSIVQMALSVPQRDLKKENFKIGLVEHTLLRLIGIVHEIREMLDFFGQCVIALVKFATGRACFRKIELWQTIQECGALALPIVSLISVLVGLILAYIGAVQLQQFGAQIYIANLVGLAMLREMGAIMASIIMAGRTGAAFAARIGSMQVNDEIDALRTLGISPVEFLVVPRMVALILMMPLLCLWADLLGIVGGAIVAATNFDISFIRYIEQTRSSVGVNDLIVGVVKSGIYGVIVAFFGCLRGIQSGRSSSAVGNAATSAVVSSIVAIIVANAFFAVFTTIIGV